MKAIPILLVFILLVLPFQPAQADSGDTVTLTADQVSGAMDIELAIAQATADGTRPGTLILDGAAGAFVFTSDDRSINIAVSNLRLLGANFAVIENCADGLFFDNVPGGNVLVEGISFICDGGGVGGLTPFERVVLRGNVFMVGGMGITIHGTPSHWTISGNKFTAGGVGADSVGADGVGMEFNGGSGFIVTRNEVRSNMGVKMREVSGFDLRSNLIRAADTGVLLTPGATGNKLESNTITGVQRAGIALEPGVKGNLLMGNTVFCAAATACLTIDASPETLAENTVIVLPKRLRSVIVVP